MVKSSNSVSGWKCDYCKKSFVYENAFLKHRCLAREKLDELRSEVGQRAYAFYSDWLRFQKRKAPAIEKFADSKFYKQFIKFATFTKEVSLSDSELFIRLMIEKDLPPHLWCRNQMYVMYLTKYDQVHTPYDQVLKTVHFLHKKAEEYEVNKNLILFELGHAKIIQFIDSKNISPWFLFACPQFGSFLKSLDEHDRAYFSNHININAWYDRLQAKSELVSELKEIITDLEF